MQVHFSTVLQYEILGSHISKLLVLWYLLSDTLFHGNFTTIFKVPATFILRLPQRLKQLVPLKCWYVSTEVHVPQCSDFTVLLLCPTNVILPLESVQQTLATCWYYIP
jgi:hypothetical protein